MKNINRETVLAEFAAYTDSYDSTNPRIKLKIDHTYRVADIAEQIAKSLNPVREFTQDHVAESKLLPGDEDAQRSACGVDVDLAWLMGMLHDVGRFEQLKIYDTFSDADSVDHANFGADLLFKEGLIDRFGSFTERELSLIEISIRNHSAYRIDGNITDEQKLYCNILRDADKVDIFRANYDTGLEDVYSVSTEELKAAAVTDSVKQCYEEGHAVLRSLKRTSIDNLIGHFCMLFELVFSRSKEIAKEQGYVDSFLSFESDNPDTKAWFQHMRNTLWQRI